jgi:phosphoglycolate phosphatase
MVKVLLFDIDGTLILSGRAGLRAMNKAFEKMYHIENALERLNLAGRTDTAIIKQVMAEHKIAVDPERCRQYQQLYYELLEQEIILQVDGKRVMPGVEQLLAELSGCQDVYIGILSGNWEISGRIKLAHFGLDRYFTFGAFADDSEIRDELLPFALQRFYYKYGLNAECSQVYVIGDTPADIQCARPHGAKSVAVAAAHYSMAELQSHNPDFLFPDLSDTKTVLRTLLE